MTRKPGRSCIFFARKAEAIGLARVPPFLPFRDGPPLFLPRLRPIPPERWLSPDTEATLWLSEKRRLMIDRREQVFSRLHGTAAAEQECLELVEARPDDPAGLPSPSPPEALSPLERAAWQVSDDLLLLRREADGEWRLCAASLCAPTFWQLGHGMGRSLGGLHAPVPGGDPGLSGRIGRIFDNVIAGHVLERFNWTVQAGAGRFTPSQTPLKQLAADTPPGDAASVLHLRVERQTIRKLAASGLMLFTIRICVDPLVMALCTREDIAAFAAAWRALGEPERDYKGWPAYEHLVSALLVALAGRTLN